MAGYARQLFHSYLNETEKKHHRLAQQSVSNARGSFVLLNFLQIIARNGWLKNAMHKLQQIKLVLFEIQL